MTRVVPGAFRLRVTRGPSIEEKARSAPVKAVAHRWRHRFEPDGRRSEPDGERLEREVKELRTPTRS